MPEPLRLLMLGKDETLFRHGETVPGDARRRHARYAQVMRDILGEDSEMRIVTYTSHGSGFRRDDPAAGLKLYGTESRHRATYLFDCIRIVREILKSGWIPTAITTQTPWEEGSLGAFLARRLGARFLPQLHFDLLAPEWRSETLLNHWRARVGTYVLRSGSRIRVVSEPLKQKVSERLNIDPSRIDVIPVGVNFEPSSLSIDQAKSRLADGLAGKPVILFVGRLVQEKNLQLWLDAASDLLGQFPDARFVIVGGGPKEQELRNIVASRGQASSILFLGPVGHEQLPDVYRAADIFLLTSHHEGFGRVILEAALAGVPSVSTRCAGPEDIIEDGVSGSLAGTADRDSVAARVADLLRDPEKRLRLGEAARQSAEARFGLDALATKLVTHWSRP